MIDEWDLTATNLHRAKRRHYEVAVLPTGAIEAHNWHLPEGQDYRHTDHVARTACRLAWPQCESVIYLPPLPYGVDCNLLTFPLSIHVSQASLDAMIRDIIGSLRRHGLRKIVLLNGHGGNEFKALIRQIQSDMDVFVFLCNWWTVGQDRYKEIFTMPDDHAGELETSVAMELYPELIEPDVAGDGRVRPTGLKPCVRAGCRPAAISPSSTITAPPPTRFTRRRRRAGSISICAATALRRSWWIWPARQSTSNSRTRLCDTDHNSISCSTFRATGSLPASADTGRQAASGTRRTRSTRIPYEWRARAGFTCDTADPMPGRGGNDSKQQPPTWAEPCSGAAPYAS